MFENQQICLPRLIKHSLNYKRTREDFIPNLVEIFDVEFKSGLSCIYDKCDLYREWL